MRHAPAHRNPLHHRPPPRPRSARTSAVALAERHYTQIATPTGPIPHRHGDHINAVLALARDRALAQAAHVDQMLAQGNSPGPLAGVPIGIKDVLAMRGAPATAGSKILAGYRPPYDATAVARLEAAGAVLTGKLNCDEFAMGSSNENSAYGPVRNPRALDRVPGGSSGGSAAAVAAGYLRRHAWHRHRRLYPPARRLLRSRRPAPHLRPRQPLRPHRLRQLA